MKRGAVEKGGPSQGEELWEPNLRENPIFLMFELKALKISIIVFVDRDLADMGADPGS